MNKRMIAFLSIISLFLTLPTFPVNAAAKAGAKCNKAGITSVASGKTYTCIKSGKKLVWDKGAATTKSVDQFVDQVQPTTFICKTDTLAPAAWKPYQDYLKSRNNACDMNFYRFVPYESAVYSGTQITTPKSELLSSESCKVRKTNNGPMLGFSSQQSNLTPYSKAKFQVVPIETTDYKSSSTPKKDYGHYFELLESWVKNNSDNGSSFEVKIPDKYIALNKSLKDYKNIDLHGYPTPEGQQFHKDLITAADPFINFSGNDLIIVVVPPQVDQNLLGTNPWGTQVTTQEGNFWKFLTITPFDFTHSGANASFLGPQLLLHEMHHSYFDFGDHGDGMGGWGLMSLPSVTGLLGWDKYIAGYYSDQQIRCLPTSKSISLLTPNVAKSQNEKLAVIPISSSKIIVIESVRVGGFNYKLPKSSEGVLVYEINIDETDYHKGVYLISTARGLSTDNKLGAPLRLNESVIASGYKISVIQTGNFGDIVEVQKNS
jgi:hypothetical protein